MMTVDSEHPPKQQKVSVDEDTTIKEIDISKCGKFPQVVKLQKIDEVLLPDPFPFSRHFTSTVRK